MAHIPMDDVSVLWNETHQHNWKAFHETVRRHKGKTNGISDALIDMLSEVSQRFERSGQPYPDSAQKMYDLLNQEIAARR